MDEIDVKLLNFLQQNSRQTTKVLANELNLSVTAVYERIKKLEKQGVIKDYVAIVDRKKINKNFLVLCHVKLVQHKKQYISEFEKEVVALPEVVECFHVSGDYDCILKLCLSDMEEYRNFMVTKLTALQHIGSTHSAFAIKEVKNTTAVEIQKPE